MKVGECALLHHCSVMILLEITVCEITPFRILTNRIFSRSNYTYIFHLSSVLQHHLQNNGTHAYCPRKTDLESSRNIHNQVFWNVFVTWTLWFQISHCEVFTCGHISFWKYFWKCKLVIREMYDVELSTTLW